MRIAGLTAPPGAPLSTPRRRASRLATLLLSGLAALSPAARAQAPASEEAATAQALVDRATLALQDIIEGVDSAATSDAMQLLRQARAALVCPRVFRAGFIFGGEGGACVLVARDAAGSWSSPAFYTMGSGSVGLQIGVQDMQVLLMVMTNRGLDALLDSQFKFGAGAGLALATVGASIQGATTTAGGADIVTVARSRGLFAGLTLDGSVLSASSGLNRAYYGRDVGPRQIVLAMQAHNPGADPLRAALMRYGAEAGAGSGAMPPPAGPQPGPAPLGGGYGTGPGTSPSTSPGAGMPGARIEQAPLPPIAGPPRR